MVLLNTNARFWGEKLVLPKNWKTGNYKHATEF
jgi:hypothetical protein